MNQIKAKQIFSAMYATSAEALDTPATRLEDEFVAFCLGIKEGEKNAAQKISEALDIPIEALAFIIAEDAIAPDKQEAYALIKPKVHNLIKALSA